MRNTSDRTSHLLTRMVKVFLVTVLLITGLFSGLTTAAQAADLEQGAKVFEMTCAGCHINGGNIVRRGKNLKQKTLEKNGYETVEAIAQLVANGKGNMSAYKDWLSAEEIEAVSTYVLQKAAEDWK